VISQQQQRAAVLLALHAAPCQNLLQRFSLHLRAAQTAVRLLVQPQPYAPAAYVSIHQHTSE
jgi:hypothetical protein